MKIINFIFEMITAPFALIIRTAEVRKNSISSVAKPIIVFLISLLIVAILVLYYYKDFIFGK